jgi:hypothetical protein
MPVFLYPIMIGNYKKKWICIGKKVEEFCIWTGLIDFKRQTQL